MAKRNSTRRAARKPKFIEVEGHQLTPAMHADYERCLESRCAMDRGANPGHALRLGLADFLARYRPSHKAGKHIQEICQTTSRVSLAVASMGEYPFFAEDASIRPAGCELLKKLALDLYTASAKLTAIAMDVETESGSRLQDWVAQSERLEQMGKGHGIV